MEKKERTEKAKDRLAVLEKIAEYEKLGIFDKDVEDDPPSRELLPDEIEYLPKGIIANIKRYFAFSAGKKFLKKMIKSKQLVLNDAIGLENLASYKGGAIITCNHFNALDSFVMQRIFYDSKRKKRMYRIIREGNYTSFSGFYGFLMKNCDVLPLSSNMATMKKFMYAVNDALKQGNLVLVYPEQSMWWNYRKPKPFKNGAFDFAVKNNVPVIPCFITLKDTEYICPDGFFAQEYTPHIGKPIYPDTSLSKKEAVEKIKNESFDFCKSVYESYYGIPLEYTTEVK